MMKPIALSSASRPPTSVVAPAVRRLSALAPLDAAETAALTAAVDGEGRAYGRLREIIGEGQPLPAPLVIVEGWAARIRVLSDGRRQILGLLLPGELIGNYDPVAPGAQWFSATTVIALTPAFVCPLPLPRAPDSGLANAYAVSRTLEDGYLFAQIVRLGRLSAYERIANLLLELHDRLALSGLAVTHSFPLPLTQEAIADITGLTSVHVNRTVQVLRKEAMVRMVGGAVELCDPVALAQAADYRRVDPPRRGGPAR